MILGLNITPCEGEISVKSYQCTEFISRFFGIKAKGYLEITTKRLLFQAIGTTRSGWSAIHKEVSIAEVSEIKIYKGSTFNLLFFIIGLIISLFIAIIVGAGIATLLRSEVGTSISTFIGLAVLAYCIYLTYLWSRKEAFSLIVNTKGGTGNVVYLGSNSPLNTNNTAATRALVYTKPGADSELMLRELGAVIQDVQALGEFAVEKWRVH